MSNSPPRRKIAAGYCRVSTDKQAERVSLEVQEKQLKEQIAKDGYDLFGIIIDEGKSARNMKREGMKEIIQLVGDKKVDAVYFIHSDRLARNAGEHIGFRNLCRDKGVSIRYLSQPMMDDSPMSITMDTVLAAFNEMSSLITGQKTKDVMAEIAKAGYFPALPPVGYRNMKNPDKNVSHIGRSIIVLDPVVGPLITETFRRYAQGDISVAALADEMGERGLINHQKRPVSAARMYDMLRNRTYLGEVHWGDVHVKEGKHTSLIDEPTFDKVQHVLEVKNRHACRRRKYKWLLAGLVTCPRHGKRYCAEWHMDKKIAYYHCSNPKGCGKYIEQTALEGMVADKFRDLEFAEDFITDVIERAKRIFMERRQKYEARRQGLVNRRTALEHRRKVAEDKLFSNVISDEDFTRVRQEINAGLAQIDDELIRLEDQRELNVDIAQEILLFTRDISKAYGKASHDLKRGLLLFFWDHFEVLNGVIVKSVPSLLFDALLHFEKAFYRNDDGEGSQENAQNNGPIISPFQCAGEDLNLHSLNGSYHLKVVRLPISPPAQVGTVYHHTNFSSNHLTKLVWWYIRTTPRLPLRRPEPRRPLPKPLRQSLRPARSSHRSSGGACARYGAGGGRPSRPSRG
jgi:site-specific DNA recombinase